MSNIEIRQKIGVSLIPKWQIAKTIGITDATFSRWLRHELPPEKKVRILAAIEKLSERGA